MIRTCVSNFNDCLNGNRLPHTYKPVMIKILPRLKIGSTPPARIVFFVHIIDDSFAWNCLKASTDSVMTQLTAESSKGRLPFACIIVEKNSSNNYISLADVYYVFFCHIYMINK
ncbi:hypothetical protein Pst134EA_019050 [Puccinia striiformis f. sp. tritici]|uniref:hypothetical protein n=1 Tax=Puccinia striiformis f. sp. tritici TaxID=168172 RepID=UPI002008A93C|nr:hypothetical protein Pst134EA_019050 [Puccinia striiformis f. sp. tritici]KAH9449138.1 hypothetical protein Pst134EB_019972 [Puccinia striiformis f. sp. tritici]KAH9458896.1 hypothetical protein Pst134EA_019050 [Puccinia striiformis f. sp. tritici]